MFAATAWSAELELVGVMQDAAGSSVALRDAPSRPALWVRVGGIFGEHFVDHFDPDTETVTLTAGASRVDLRLRAARVQSGDAAAGDYALRSAASEKAVAWNLQALATAAYQHFWDTGTSHAATADFVGPDRALFRIEAVAGEDYAALRFTLQSDGQVSVTERNGAAIPTATNEAVAILVTVGTTLEAVSRRLGVSLTQLTELNPAFALRTPTGATQSVRIR